jgi:hypothetical protein
LKKFLIKIQYNTKKKLKKFKLTSDHFFEKKAKTIKNYYDIIYVDGNHNYEIVFRDGLNSFNVLKIGGIIIFDDFIGYYFFKKYNENPFGAIIVLINIFYKKIKILKITNQIIIQKISN